MTLSEVMHVHIPTLSLESTVRDAVDKMDIYQFPALVIVDNAKRPVGVVTEGDLGRAVSAKGDITGLSQSRVIDFATLKPAVADMRFEVGESLHLMLSQGLTILPVVADGRLMGVALRIDLMQAMLMDVSVPLQEEV